MNYRPNIESIYDPSSYEIPGETSHVQQGIHVNASLCFLLGCSATHSFRTTKPKIRILGIVLRNGCVALHYSVHFFSNFSLSRNDRNRGGGYRCKICTVPTLFLCLPDPLEKMRGSNSGPCVWLPLVLPLNHIRSYMVE